MKPTDNKSDAMNHTANETYPRGSTPVPDPTVLTTQQLTREIAASREIIETRLNAMDVATALNKESADRVPLMIRDAVVALEKLTDEKFSSIQTQFQERDTRTEQTRTSDKVAVDAALQAQKEAAGAQNESNAEANKKTESNFTKQIDQIGTLITTNIKGLQDQITEIKGRLDRGEGTNLGAREQKTESSSKNQWMIGLLVVGVLQFIGFLVGIVALFMK